ncbi:MAG TPA: hypothetical protein VGD24_00375 [Gallionella sp.]
MKIYSSASHHEYRLMIPAGKQLDDITGPIKAAVEQLGEWEERSHDEIDSNRPEYRETLADLAAHGASLWMVSLDYTGHIAVIPAGQIGG